MSNPNIDDRLVPTGRIKSGSGDGVNFAFETQAEQDDHEDRMRRRKTADSTCGTGLRLSRVEDNPAW